MRRYGESGARLSRLANGLDERPVSIDGAMKTISAETTFNSDIASFDELLSSLVQANGLIVLRHEQGDVTAGDVVEILMFDTTL